MLPTCVGERAGGLRLRRLLADSTAALAARLALADGPPLTSEKQREGTGIDTRRMHSKRAKIT